MVASLQHLRMFFQLDSDCYNRIYVLDVYTYMRLHLRLRHKCKPGLTMSSRIERISRLVSKKKMRCYVGGE